MTTKSQSLSNQGKDSLRYAQEATLTRKVKEWLDTQEDVTYYKASDRYQKGVSDIIANVGGIFTLIELKADKGVERPHQKLFIKEMTRVGGIGGFCYTVGEVKELVNAARSIKNNY